VPIAPKPAGRPEIGKLPDICQTDWKTKPATEALPKEKEKKKEKKTLAPPELQAVRHTC